MGNRQRAAVVALLAVAACASPAADQARVIRVVDGDTVVVRLHGKEERLRVIGIDTPEVHESAKLEADAERTGRDKATIQALGKRASIHAKTLLEGERVALEYGDTTRDRYKRILAYLMLEEGTDFGLKMIEDGYALAMTRYPHPRMDQYVEAERAARSARRGLWQDGMDAGVAPEAPPAVEPGEARFVASRRSTVYHSITCKNASSIAKHNRVLFASEEEARGSGRRRCRCE